MAEQDVEKYEKEGLSSSYAKYLNSAEENEEAKDSESLTNDTSDDGEMELFEKVKIGKNLQEIKSFIKGEFTITGHSGKNRVCTCKTKDCPRKGLVVPVGPHFELKVNQYQHLPQCKKPLNPFESKEVMQLCKLNRLKPLDILREYNKGKEKSDKIRS